MNTHRERIWPATAVDAFRRRGILNKLLEMGHIPVGMEMFSAADEQQWETIKKQIDQSDYYVVLVARRYGSMDGDVSFTEKEYEYALSQKIPALGFILDSSVDWPEKWVENNNDIRKRLDNFKAKVSGRMVSFWKTPEDLYGRSGIALMKAFASQPREGWVRASAANMSDMTAEITRLSKENGQLRSQLAAKLQSEVESKTSKVDEMIDALRRNVRKIYVWKDGAKDWGDPKGTNLLELFEYMAPDLLDEAGNRTLADSLGLHFASTSVRGNWPVPSNFVKAYLADFVGLGMVTNSPKRHSVQDTQSYWTLTQFGREVHGSIRRNELLRGLAAFEEAPEDDAPEA